MKSARSSNTKCPFFASRVTPSGSVASGNVLALFTRDSGGVVGSYARDARADAFSTEASRASWPYATGAVRAREEVRRDGGDVDAGVVILRRFGGAVAARAALSTPSSRMRVLLRAMFASRIVSYAFTAMGTASCGACDGWSAVGTNALFRDVGQRVERTVRSSFRHGIITRCARSALTRCDAETRRGW